MSRPVSPFRRRPACARALLAGAVLLLAAACAVPAPQPAEAPGAAETYAPLPADGATLYRIDAAASRVAIYVFRGGSAARFGHNHVLAVPQLEGAVRVPDGPAGAAQFALRFSLDALRIDDAAQRAATGGSFASARSAQDIDGTRRNMLKSLDAARYPEVVIRSLAVHGDWPVLVADVAISLHGVRRTQTVPLHVERGDGRLRARGSLAIRQSDFGIAPFSILGGALAVQDVLAIEFDLVAVGAD
ncbi:YceI family protein [Solimonas flava]|uniref:YceI family protein n=1 Tax=Solimonas flava TaxID=415849 RepID=UPI0006891719|nr:YceI family protein [Solimonas flava]